ncbi:MAG: hypothetical protein AAGF30_10395, partial [Pseudomonadota bacterium]
MGGLLFALSISLAGPSAAQDDNVEGPDWTGVIEPVSGFTGEMSMTMETEVPEDMAVEEVIRFEPWQMLDELFRDDLVFLMRSGPSDWAAQDAADTAPQDCENQRLLTQDGQDQMRQLGALLTVNELRPGRVVMSEWCRSQQTYIGLETGMLDADMNAMDGMTSDLNSDLNPLGATNGATDTATLEDMIMNWD